MSRKRAAYAKPGSGTAISFPNRVTRKPACIRGRIEQTGSSIIRLANYESKNFTQYLVFSVVWHCFEHEIAGEQALKIRDYESIQPPTLIDLLEKLNYIICFRLKLQIAFNNNRWILWGA